LQTSRILIVMYATVYFSLLHQAIYSTLVRRPQACEHIHSREAATAPLLSPTLPLPPPLPPWPPLPMPLLPPPPSLPLPPLLPLLLLPPPPLDTGVNRGGGGRDGVPLRHHVCHARQVHQLLTGS
jgi:hypothetical protein